LSPAGGTMIAVISLSRPRSYGKWETDLQLPKNYAKILLQKVLNSNIFVETRGKGAYLAA